MGAAWLGYWAALDRWEAQPDPQLFIDGIPLLAWYGLALLGAAAVLRWRCRSPRPPAFAEVLAVGMGAVPVPLLLFTLGGAYLNPSCSPAQSPAPPSISFCTWPARCMASPAGRSAPPP